MTKWSTDDPKPKLTPAEESSGLLSVLILVVLFTALMWCSLLIAGLR